MAFSPASGKAMKDCKPEQYLDQLKIPLLSFRPEIEMTYDSVIAQEKIFKAKNLPYISIENGVHGSSMLVKKRTEHNMAKAWSIVNNFITKVTN